MTMQRMQRLGDLMHQEPDAEQAETTRHVLEIAVSWQCGDLSLDAVHGLCSGFERWQAIRFADPTSEGYAALRALVEALVAADPGVLRTVHGIVVSEERFAGSVKSVTNYRNQRVMVWPLCWIDGEPHYPPVHVPPGEERREFERALQSRYEAYRKAKGRSAEPASRRHAWPS